MKKKVILILFGLAAAALAVIAVRQRNELRALRSVGKAAGRDTAAPASVARAADEQAVSKRVAPQPEVRGASANPSAAAAPAAARPPPAGGSNEASPLAGLAKMIKSPGMKEMIRAQSKGQMDLTYGALFRGLSLDADTLESFKEILLDRQMAMMDLGLNMMDGSATRERRKEMAEQIAKQAESYDEQIKGLLGEENFAVYKEYEATQPERMQVNLFKQSLSGADPLSVQQEHDLIRAMYDERQSFPLIGKQFDRTSPPDPATFTDEMLTNQLAQMAQLQDKSLARASAILNAGQLEQFKASQERLRAMQQMGLKMAAQMFGKTAPPPAASEQAK